MQCFHLLAVPFFAPSLLPLPQSNVNMQDSISHNSTYVMCIYGPIVGKHVHPFADGTCDIIRQESAHHNYTAPSGENTNCVPEQYLKSIFEQLS